MPWVQDAAYGTLLREPRPALHARIVEALESQFMEVVESQPDLLAHHSTQAGLIEKAARLWSKAGQRSLVRSALVEAAAQLERALAQIATLPGTPALRHEQIKLQIALANALAYVKSYMATETIAALERARLFIEQAKMLGESPEDELQLFYVLYGFWVANFTAFSRDVVCGLAAEFLVLAEKQRATGPLSLAHRLMGVSLVVGGRPAAARPHFDRAQAFDDPVEHRALTDRFGHEIGVPNLTYRSWALWILGYPEAALKDAEASLARAAGADHAATLMHALGYATWVPIQIGSYARATAHAHELVSLANKKSVLQWKTIGMFNQGCLLDLTGRAAEAVETLSSALAAWRELGAKILTPIALGARPRPAWAIRAGLAICRRSVDRRRGDPARVVRDGGPPHRWRDCTDVVRAGHDQSRSVLRACARDRA
jgi:tetratricopeptide (TPR) repeat protein